MSKKKWKLIRDFSFCHRIWKNTENGQYYLADESGDDRDYKGTPDDTDDGPIRFDPSRPIQLGYDYGSMRGNYCCVPIILERNGEKSTTGSTMTEMLWLSAKFGYEIVGEDDNVAFRVGCVPSEG